MMKENMTQIIEKHSLKLLVSVQLLISLILFTVRHFSYSGIFIGSSSYYHAAKAAELSADFLQAFHYHPYQVLLAAFDVLFGSMDTASQLTPVLLGLISMILLFFVIRSLNIDPLTGFITCFMVIISPIYIYISNVSNSYILSVLIMLLAFYTLIKYGCSPGWLFLFLLMPLLGIFETLLAVALLLYCLSKHKEAKSRILVIIFCMLTLMSYFFVLNKDLLPDNVFISKFITSFGAYLGVSVFILLLAVIGVIFSWKNKKELIFIYLTTLVLFICFIYIGQYAAIFLNFILCYFGAFALMNLFDYKWDLGIVRDLTLMVLICGLLFTTISYTNRLSTSLPDKELKMSLLELQSRTPENSTVLSDYENGFWIQYFAGRKSFTDLYSMNVDESTMLGSREFSSVSKLLDKYSISFIYITPAMKQKLWPTDEDGLLFLLPYKARFGKMYERNGFEIWRVLNVTKSVVKR